MCFYFDYYCGLLNRVLNQQRWFGLCGTFPAEMVAVTATVFNNLWYQEELISKLSNAKLNDALVAQISDIWPCTEPFKWWRTLCKMRPFRTQLGSCSSGARCQLSAATAWSLPTDGLSPSLINFQVSAK